MENKLNRLKEKQVETIKDARVYVEQTLNNAEAEHDNSGEVIFFDIMEQAKDLLNRIDELLLFMGDKT